MKKYKNMLFFDAETGGGEGGGGQPDGESVAGTGEMTRGATAFDIPKTGTGERALPEKKTGATGAGAGPIGAGTGEPVTEVPAKEPAGFDASKFAKDFGDVLGTTLKPILERADQKPPMTPEEARKILKTWEPDDNWYKTYDNLETRKDAVLQMRDALVQQADTLAQMRLQQVMDEFRKELEPELKSVRETTERQREERFATKYPTLANPALKPLIKAVAEDFVAKKQTFNSEEELFTALGKGVESVIKVNNPEFKLEVASNGSGQQAADRGGRAIPVTSPGGGGGTGRQTGGNEQPVKRGLAIFGK